jgi:hypothetical protein
VLLAEQLQLSDAVTLIIIGLSEQVPVKGRDDPSKGVPPLVKGL